MQIGLVYNCLEPGQFTLVSMVLIRYPCGHISGHHEPIHVKFGVWGFFIMFYWNMVMKMLKCKKENLMMSHFSTLWRTMCVLQTPYHFHHKLILHFIISTHRKMKLKKCIVERPEQRSKFWLSVRRRQPKTCAGKPNIMLRLSGGQPNINIQMLLF